MAFPSIRGGTKSSRPSSDQGEARAALAAVMAEAQAADAVLKDLASSREKLSRGVYDAADRVTKAKDAVDEATAAAALYLTARAMGATGDAPPPVKTARVALQDAEDDYSVAVAARDSLDDRVNDAKHSAEKAKRRIREAAAEVVRDAAVRGGLFEEVLRLQQQLVNKGRVLSWLVNQGIIPGFSGSPRHDGDPLQPIWRTYNFIDMLPVDYLVEATPGRVVENQAIFSGVPEWQVAFDALQRDANAPLPSAG